MSTVTADDVCDAIWQIEDPSAPTVATVAADAGKCAESADTILTVIEGAALQAKESSNEGQLAAMWALLDRLCKDVPVVYVDKIRKRLVAFSERFYVPRASPHFQRFLETLEGFKAIFGTSIMHVVSLKLKALLGAAATVESSSASAAAPGFPQPKGSSGPQQGALGHSSVATSAPGTTDRTRMQLSTTLRTIGGLQMQRANNGRPTGAQHTLQVKTRDSLQAVRTGALYAPAKPVEMDVVMPERDADAPVGHMQALPANHAEQYLAERRQRAREIASKWRQEEENRRRRQPSAEEGGSSSGAPRPDTFADVVMPAELPRDEFGVKRGNFPAGVRFLREAIRACKGALPLALLEERVAQMSDREAQAEFGNLREFLHIHQPTFAVVEERDQWIVRLTDDDPPDPTQSFYTWEQIECPLCSFLVRPGRNYSKHLNCRRCIDIQTANGMSGKPFGPVGELAFAARCILAAAGNDTLDDDDVLHFAQCVEAAGSVWRYNTAASQRFLPMLKALRVLRDRWLKSKGASSMATAVIEEEDGPYVALFAAFGRNMRRLPIPWIETGDIVDMSRRFTSELLPPPPPMPRAGDPRIRVGNPYGSVMFAESDTDPDDIPSDNEEEFSDDESALFEFAPPVSVMETMMAAGLERETKKLNFRLRTAPPIPASTAVKSDGSKTHGQLYKASGQ